MSFEYLITALIIILIPGTGVIYTITIGIARGRIPSFFAAFGCTMGILPHIMASIMGLAAILHTSALLFQIVKYAGAAYLLFLAFQILTQKGSLSFDHDGKKRNKFSLIKVGFLINILNPKLSIFFLAFLPQFISPTAQNPVWQMLFLGVIFMLMTFIIFVIYGNFAALAREKILASKAIMKWFNRSSAAIFAFLSLKLALSEK